MKAPILSWGSLWLAAAFAASAFAAGEGPAAQRIQFCLAAAADGAPVYPTRTFLCSARELGAVWRLDEGQSVEALTAVWTAVDVGEAAPPNFEIARLDQPLRGQIKGRFRYSQPNPLPAGTYRLTILADGMPWASGQCAAVPGEKPAETYDPSTLFPLGEGRTWSYDLLLEGGQRAKVSLPGVAPDPDGKLRAKVTIAVGKSEAAGTRVEIRRNGESVFEEWWRVNAAGLVSTQRGPPGSLTRLDPPQVLLAQPLEARQTWKYESKDGSFQQTCEQWGPLPVRGPRGEQSGYIVLVEQASPQGKLTVERHFIPGFGLVREVIVSSLGGELASRQEMTLRPEHAESIAGAESGAASRPTPASAEKGQGSPPSLKFEGDFQAALERARKEGKPLLCEFYTTSCRYCKQMESSVYPEPEIAEFSSRHVWVRLDQEKGEGSRLVREFKAGKTPTYMAIAADGKTPYYRFSDAVSKEGFLHNLGLISVPPEEYRKILQNPEARLPTPQELLVLAKGALMKGEMAEARRTLEAIAAKDPPNASGLVDDALVLLASMENAAWTDEGAKKAREVWTRVLNDYPGSDRAPDAVFYLAELFGEVGPQRASRELSTLLKDYPRGVDLARARKVVAGD